MFSPCLHLRPDAPSTLFCPPLRHLPPPPQAPPTPSLLSPPRLSGPAAIFTPSYSSVLPSGLQVKLFLSQPFFFFKPLRHSGPKLSYQRDQSRSLSVPRKAAVTVFRFKKKTGTKRDELTWYEVQVGLSDGRTSCHTQTGRSGIKGQVVWPRPHTHANTVSSHHQHGVWVFDLNIVAEIRLQFH